MRTSHLYRTECAEDGYFLVSRSAPVQWCVGNLHTVTSVTASSGLFMVAGYFTNTTFMQSEAAQFVHHSVAPRLTFVVQLTISSSAICYQQLRVSYYFGFCCLLSGNTPVSTYRVEYTMFSAVVLSYRSTVGCTYAYYRLLYRLLYVCIACSRYGPLSALPVPSPLSLRWQLSCS